jgi:hypothetical protein
MLTVGSADNMFAIVINHCPILKSWRGRTIRGQVCRQPHLTVVDGDRRNISRTLIKSHLTPWQENQGHISTMNIQFPSIEEKSLDPLENAVTREFLL